MKEKAKSFFKRNIKRKRTWVILGIVIIIICYSIFKTPNSAKNTTTDIAKLSDLKETVLTTGQVVSSTDLDLSFNSTGVVKNINVKVGDKVKKGQIIATLNQDSELASLTSARGALAAAKARLQKTLDGATNEQITLSEVALEQTKLTQDTLVSNAYQNLLNSTPEAVPSDGKSNYTAPTISGTYTLGKEGTIYLKVYSSSGGRSFDVTGLTMGTSAVDTITPQPIGNSGLYIKFPSGSVSDVSNWEISIPNKHAANYLTNYNAYQAALATAKSAIDQSTASLNLTKASATTSDIDLAKADILSAEGQVEQAQARYNNTLVIAPADGTITSVDIKVGEQAQALKEVMVLQDINDMHLETNVNEANIASLSIGMPIDITYDSLGESKIFHGTITKIDPASTLVSGVVNYKVTASTDQFTGLRPGMTANMTIKVLEKDNVIAIPSRAIIKDDKGNESIRIITNKRTKKWKSVPVTTGLEGDGGMVEISSGLKLGDEYVVLTK